MLIFICIFCRPGSLQTHHQVHHVKNFEDWLNDVRMIYGQPKQYYTTTGQDLRGIMIRQNKFLHGQEARDLRYIPKV